MIANNNKIILLLLEDEEEEGKRYNLLTNLVYSQSKERFF